MLFKLYIIYHSYPGDVIGIKKEQFVTARKSLHKQNAFQMIYCSLYVNGTYGKHIPIEQIFYPAFYYNQFHYIRGHSQPTYNLNM